MHCCGRVTMPRVTNGAGHQWGGEPLAASSPSPRASASRPSELIRSSSLAIAARRLLRTHLASRLPDSVGITTTSRRLVAARCLETSPAACIRSSSLLTADADPASAWASRFRFRLPAWSSTSSARNCTGGTLDPISSIARSQRSTSTVSPHSADPTSSSPLPISCAMSDPIRHHHADLGNRRARPRHPGDRRHLAPAGASGPPATVLSINSPRSRGLCRKPGT
jgi:hypothetical protein